jgi:hypothetical protein
MSEKFRLRVRVGDAEFEADAPAEEVKSLFEEWKRLVETWRHHLRNGGGSAGAFQGKPEQPAGSNTPDPELTKRVFAERGGVISLLGLPRTDNAAADALVLLLYGYKLMKADEYPVTGVRLMQAAQQTGIQIDRADRAISARDDLLVTSGYKRSKRYSLNNRGEQHALMLMQQLFE